MKLRDQLEYTAVAGLLALCRIFPEAWVYAIFKGLGLLTYAALGARRKLALQNTAIAFPDKPLEERRLIVRSHFLNLAESMAVNALIMSGRISNDRILSMVDTSDWNKFEQILSNSSNGALVITGHLGNWELMSQYVALRLENRQIHVIARESNNPLFEERILLPLRERFGVSVFYKKNALMKIMKAAKRGALSGILIDQKLNPPEGIDVEFFGRAAGTTPSSAVLQIRFGLDIVPMFLIRSGPRAYRLIVGDPIGWTGSGEVTEAKILELTRIHQHAIEEMIRDYPDQWFWVHNRWGLRKQEYL